MALPRGAASLAVLLMLGPLAPARAQPRPDPDWPCVQRKIPTIAAGTVWSGPSLDEVGPWTQDTAAAALARKLASRRTPLEEADALIDDFAREAGPARAERLTRVFAGVLELVNGERERVLAGIERYGRGQRRLAEHIREQADRISAVKDAPDSPTTKDTQELETRFAWDKRIFEERNQTLTAVCETPVLLEQRVFEIARRIEARL
jgi:hypothetical protein